MWIRPVSFRTTTFWSSVSAFINCCAPLCKFLNRKPFLFFEFCLATCKSILQIGWQSLPQVAHVLFPWNLYSKSIVFKSWNFYSRFWFFGLISAQWRIAWAKNTSHRILLVSVIAMVWRFCNSVSDRCFWRHFYLGLAFQPTQGYVVHPICFLQFFFCLVEVVTVIKIRHYLFHIVGFVELEWIEVWICKCCLVYCIRLFFFLMFRCPVALENLLKLLFHLLAFDKKSSR